MNILLVSDGSWDRTLRLAAASMSDAALRPVRSVPAAYAQLGSIQPFSCIVVQAGRCSGQLRHLADLARYAGHDPAEFIILGRDGEAPPGVTVLPADASTESLSRVLASIEEGCARNTGHVVLRDEDVPDALAASRLNARYQPIVDVATGVPLALEVLARLEHPLLGRLKPAQFVPQLEFAGLAFQLTEAVVDATLLDYRRHLSRFGMSLALNLPLDVLMRHDMAGWLEERCEQSGLSPRDVIIELTESQPVSDLNAADHRRLVATMRHMRLLGFRLALDDYGPEMPQRLDLLDLPFDIIKLDKSVVNTLGHTGLIEQAVAVSKGRFKLIAEGVEDQATWRRMAGLGVDYIQGFLVSRPLPAQNVVDWIDEWRGRPA